VARKPAAGGRRKLRADAKAQVARDAASGKPRPSSKDLQHDLQVHQIELEMQNEQLRRSQIALEESRNRYVDLYDFAPVGYFTLSASGLIQEANLTGAVLLGVERGRLRGRRFSRFVRREDADRWHLFLSALVRDGSSPNICNLVLQRFDDTAFDAYLVCHRQLVEGTLSEIRIVLTDVSESSRLETELRATKERLSYVIDGSNDGFFDWDVRRSRLKFSRRFALMLGSDLDQMDPSTTSMIQRIHPEDLERATRATERHMVGETANLDVELRLRHEDGRWLWVVARGKVVERDEALGPLRLAGTVTDISDRKRAEVSLRVSELALRIYQARLELAARAGKLGMWDLDLSTNQAWRTSEHDRLFGYDEMLPHWGPADALRHVHPEDRHIFQRAFDQAMVTGRFHYELRIDPLNHPQRWIEADGEVLRDQAGKPVRMMGTVADITDRKRAEEAMTESRRTLALFVDHAPAAIAMFDRQMRYLAASRRWLTDYRLDQTDILGRSHYEVFPEIPERWKEVHRRCLSGAVERCDRDPFPRTDGTLDWVRWEIHPWRDGEGNVGGLVMFTEVITEQVALQAQLALASRLAAMGTLVTGVAHEINNPLAAEMADQGLSLEVVREVRDRIAGDSPLDRGTEARALDRVIEALEDAQEGGKRIAQIVKDLTIFGRPDLKRQRARLLDVVEAAMRWLPATVARTASIQVENAGAPDVFVSAGQIEQVLVNLITNAARATPAGGRDMIIVRVGPGGPGRARLDVIDHGVGMSATVLERIFDPFFTTRPTGTERGMGLGLAICHAIVTAHGGTLTVTSQEGSGSTFRMELPAAPVEPG